jgi:transcriptional regulator with XRE-family HTH domain
MKVEICSDGAVDFAVQVESMRDMDIKKRFAQNLIEQRDSRGLTPEDLARSASIPLDHLESIESGREEPLMGTLIQLARMLEVPVGTLVAGLDRDPDDGFSVADD